jgi:phage-related protein
MKPLHFMGSSLDDLRNFPDEARRAAGFELRAIQSGLEPSDWKPMQGIGPGVNEIRIHVLGEWRSSMLPSFTMRCMYFMHSKRKLERRADRISI